MMTEWRSADIKEQDLEAELQRLHISIDGLSQAMENVKAEIRSLFAMQSENYRILLKDQNDNFLQLIERQDKMFEALVDRQDGALKDFVSRQDTQFKGFVERQDRNQSETLSRQETHFRWLIGAIVGTGFTILCTLIVKFFS